jgi:internalin A
MAKRSEEEGFSPLEVAEQRIQEARWKSVSRLDLSILRLHTLPESIGHLSQLKELYLFFNSIASLPKSIGQLTQLQVLDLGGNSLASLPEALGHLRELRRLDLSQNKLTSLPQSIGRLTQLEELYLDNNRLTSLPEAIKQLRSLKELYLQGNEDLGLPPEVLGPSWKQTMGREAKPSDPAQILDYYFRLRGGRRPLNEAKLILVGHGDVGKTCIVNRLLHDKFDPHELKTEGIRINSWPIRLRGEEEVRLNVWDFGGQEIMHSTHQFFLTQRSLYLLILNGRPGHEDFDAEYWLNLVRSFGGDSPVVIVLNKIREHPFDLNRGGLREKFPSIRDFVETDCADGTGIRRLREVIYRETDRLEHLRDSFPSAWFTIKDHLAGTRKNYMTFDEYRRLCATQGEKDPAAQNSLAFYLHSLGIALNFKDDPRLRDTHVLNPHWVTSGIYNILNARKLAEQKGALNIEDLATILKPDEYPPHMHPFLFDLMRKFELCFSFPEDDGRFLVPELLAKQQPVETEDFRPAQCLNFEYRYPTFPEGLLPRFIVRTHVLSTDLPRWRTGVILEFEGNRALVKADVQDKCVRIAVSGPKDGRRRLLAVIRSDFEHIHRSFKFQPIELVPLPDHPDVAVLYGELVVLEQNDIGTFPKVVAGDLLQLNVQGLLSGVDLEGVRRTTREAAHERPALRLFYSYSHKDEDLRNQLETHLKLLERLNLILHWHDRKITAGTEWKGQIDENLEQADIILLLVSADFLASDYCYDVEMKRAMERHEAKDARVIPVIVRDVDWSAAPFAKLQVLPTDAKAVTKQRSRDTAWRNVAEGIKKVLAEIQADRG